MANSTKINGRRARTGVGAGGMGGMGGMAPAATAGMAGGALGAVPGMGGKHHVTDASIEHKDLMQVAPGIPASSTQPAVSGSSAAVAAHHAPDLMKPMAALHAIGSGHPGQPMPDQARGTTGGSGIRTNDVVMHHPGMVTADSAPLDASVGKVAMQDSGNVTLQGQPTNIFTAM
ncbi:MAG: hypothetical protein EOP02_09835 [Proteobacteria bacterium]|nr:MAG: hypothetical protein EOP02_09835 [Pseudomonadota bacterium]